MHVTENKVNMLVEKKENIERFNCSNLNIIKRTLLFHINLFKSENINLSYFQKLYLRYY